MAECDPPAELSREVSDLMSRKLATRELGVAPLPPVVARFLDSEFELARATFENQSHAPEKGILEAEQFYRMVVQRLEREGQ